MVNKDKDHPRIDQQYDPEAALAEYQSAAADEPITPDAPFEQSEVVGSAPEGFMQPIALLMLDELRQARESFELAKASDNMAARGPEKDATELRLKQAKLEYEEAQSRFEATRQEFPDEPA